MTERAYIHKIEPNWQEDRRWQTRLSAREAAEGAQLILDGLLNGRLTLLYRILHPRRFQGFQPPTIRQACIVSCLFKVF